MSRSLDDIPELVEEKGLAEPPGAGPTTRLGLGKVSGGLVAVPGIRRRNSIIGKQMEAERRPTDDTPLAFPIQKARFGEGPSWWMRPVRGGVRIRAYGQAKPEMGLRRKLIDLACHKGTQPTPVNVLLQLEKAKCRYEPVHVGLKKMDPATFDAERLKGPSRPELDRRIGKG